MSDVTHTVKSYEDELQGLNDNLIKMGSLVESQLSDSMEAIIKVDKDAADKIIKNDEKINELRAIIEEQIVTVLVKRAPMAIDLRLTISTLKISSDLERIGDLAKSVAKKIKPLPHNLPEELVTSLKRLGSLVQTQLKDVLDAYLNQSKTDAIKIWKTDEKVDDLTHIAMNEVAKFLSEDKKFTYNTFCVTVFEEFIPVCNGESSGYAWVGIHAWPKPLHRGARAVLEQPDMVEKITTIYNRQKDKLDLPNWLDSF